jgi:hypothetical protein
VPRRKKPTWITASKACPSTVRYEKADASCAGTGYRIVGTDGTPQAKDSEKTLGVDVGNFTSRSVVVVCK